MQRVLIRHGDVLLERVGPPRADVAARTDSSPVVLAEGETTGHLHRLHQKYGGATMFRDDAMAGGMPPSMYIGNINVIGDADLRHELADGTPTGEHNTLDVPSGEYLVRGQREYDPAGERRAGD